jgi:hypothetical protein
LRSAWRQKLKRRGFHPTERGPTFAGELARRVGVRHVRFAVRVRDFPPIQRAKLRFGTVAVAALLACVCRAILRCPGVALR